MNIRYSVLLIACCILAFSRIASAFELLTCNVPFHSLVQISNSMMVILHEFDLTVQLESDKFVLTTYEGINAVGILATNVLVTYNGSMQIAPSNWENSKVQAPQVLVKTYTNKMYGVAQREVSKSSDFDGCRIVLLSTEIERDGAIGRVPNEIRRLAEACIEMEYCQKIGTMKPQRMESLLGKNISNVMLTCPESRVNVNENCATQYDPDNVQPVLNKAVDVGLFEISEKLRALNGGTIAIYNVDKTFPTGVGILRTTSYFRATNASFRDLTTLRRLSDVTITHMKEKVILICQFKLEIAEINFPHYELKYSFIEANGMLKGSMNNIAIALRVAVDYNRHPCRALIEHLNVTKLGEISIQFTGLGPLTWMVSQLLNLISNMWREDIVVIVKQNLIALVEEKLSSVNCEKYRS